MYVAVPAIDGNGGACIHCKDLKDIVIQYQNVMRLQPQADNASMVALVFAWYLSRTIQNPDRPFKAAR